MNRNQVKKDVRLADRIFRRSVQGFGVALGLTLFVMAFFLFQASLPALKNSSWFSFLTQSNWDPVQDVYGALPVIFGTLVSSLLALLIAFPLSVSVALFLIEIAPSFMKKTVGFLIEMLAAIPSVVFGLWGVFVLVPFLRKSIQPFMIEHFGFIPLFEGPAFGVGMFAAALILAIMILPTISSLAKEVFQAIPMQQREAALALGATRWEMIKLAVLASSRGGLFAAMVLGLGRALGETMAVTMVIGNRSQITASLFAPAQTMASVIANEYAEATSDLHLSSLALVGLSLFAVTFVTNALARLWLLKIK